MKNKKIALISIHNLLDNRISKHISTLANNDYDIYYINVSLGEDINIPNVKLFHMNMDISGNIFKYLKAYKYILKTIKAIKPNIVHCHDINLFPVLLLSKNTKKIFDRHEIYEQTNDINSKVFCPIEKLVAKYLDAAVCVTENEVKYLNEIGYKNVACIPNYQSKIVFDSVDVTPSNKSQYTALYIGSLAPLDRDIEKLLDIFEMLLKNNVFCRLGGNIIKQKDKDKIDYLQAKYNNFKYLGYCSYDTVIKETKIADFVILPLLDSCKTISCPNKLTESLLAEAIFIGIGNFELKNLLEKNDIGKIFDQSISANEVSDYILQLIKGNKVKKMKNNIKKIKNDYTWEKIENRYIDLYKTI